MRSYIERISCRVLGISVDVQLEEDLITVVLPRHCEHRGEIEAILLPNVVLKHWPSAEIVQRLHQRPQTEPRAITATHVFTNMNLICFIDL
jgi:hypothetical protein